MAYNSCRINQAQKSVLKYSPKHNHLLSKNQIELLKNHVNTIVYLTLSDQEGFWFFLKECNETQVKGLVKHGERWVYRIIELASIYTFC
ncbi:hypothetical protein [Anaerotignum sp.]|uniref:hypothetical protein n=1 Tax=Anaerotignum sp. TaxID=2039241 RepID=UPI0028A5B0E8|nr:hypothetical protein [Anaerotignum sp.]